MADTVSIVIDGQPVEVLPGTTIRAACEQIGKPIPTLCWHPNLTPANACRACVVEVEGSRALVASCSRPVEDQMKIHTDTERVRNARKTVAELLASAVDIGLAADVQNLIVETQADIHRFNNPEQAHVGIKDDNDLYIRDLDKCILCYRCVNTCGTDAQNTFAIAVAGRGLHAHIDPGTDRWLTDSDCVFCGNCVAVCPTGALMGKKEWQLRQEGRWDESQIHVTETICTYCGVGCDLELHVLDNDIVKVTSPFDHPVTHGMLCVKGRYGYDFVQQEE
ncbi:4Fe-4S binding domain-containing protein [Sulfobacillus thermosulfidooxidans DSM 9293]|uniref:Ferredoxin n=1 Tax=Sulfobacillus thermosulfidooxidans (strain DSM 9293 / VKM B-1269 / AT-1) TaxID=929705 RepID=A0A1W1WEX4_SULTA|nr:2Fe-2S iron-sulfur cluster-binding protein [Sulfobacillus thermosulfidooxidans]SMC04854.1 4Fe-4S binding domain-containing protein [Sulfobacillus thermosulfidooxidans DSM 9293]